MTQTASPTIDEARVAATGERLVGVLNDACTALMISIGHQVGLFDTMAALPPATSHEIAGAAGLHERYVREWLGGLTVAQLVEYEVADGTYRLPAEHAAVLTRAAGPDNLASTMQFVSMLAGVESSVVSSFRHGGGVPYAAYTDFHRLMAEDSAALHDAELVETIIPLVPGLPERLRDGVDVADIGCGSGHAINLLAEAYPASRFVGYDFAEEGVAAARHEAEALGLTNATFEVRDVTDLAEVERYDLITAFDAIHDQAQPAVVLAGVAEALRPGGVFLMVDIRASSKLEENHDHPIGPFLYAASTMHCMTVSLSLGGVGLGTVWGEQLAGQMLADAGFTDIDTRHVDADILNTYYIARRG